MAETCFWSMHMLTDLLYNAGFFIDAKAKRTIQSWPTSVKNEVGDWAWYHTHPDEKDPVNPRFVPSVLAELRYNGSVPLGEKR